MNEQKSSSRPPLWRLILDNVLQDQIPMRAAALSFQTLAYLLPVLAVILAILSGPAFEKQREQVLDRLANVLVPDPFAGLEAQGDVGPPLPPDLLSEHRQENEPEVRQGMVAQLKDTLRGSIRLLADNLGKISAFSFLILLFISFRLFQTIENAFNAIWKIKHGRPAHQKFMLTTSLLVLGPVMLVFSVGLTEFFKDYKVVSGYLLPVIFTGFAFTAFYSLVPTTRVRFFAAFIGGMAAAMIWELSKYGFLLYVTHAVGVSALYGSLGLIPVIFAWVYLSWLVVFAGAEIAFGLQNHGIIVTNWDRKQREARLLSETDDIVLEEAAMLPRVALAVAIEMAHRFKAGHTGGIKLAQIQEQLQVELGVLQRGIDRMQRAGLVVKVACDATNANADEEAYLLARDLSQLQLDALIEAAEGGLKAEKSVSCPTWQCVNTLMTKLDQARKDAFGEDNVLHLLKAHAHTTAATARVTPETENVAQASERVANEPQRHVAPQPSTLDL